MTGGGRRSARSRIKTHDDDSLGNSRPYVRTRRDRRKDLSSIRVFKANLRLVIGLCIVGSVVMYFVINRLIISAEESRRPRVVTPFPAPRLMDLPMFQGDHKESLYWGTYRPHVYLGIRARAPQSLVAGLMWIGVKDGMYHMRHVCQNDDNLITYGWRKHNGRDFGYQELVDQNMMLETSFLKTKGEGSGFGGDWAVRIDVKDRLNEEMKGSGHLFFYLADEAENTLSIARDMLDIRESFLVASGSRSDVGGWQLHLKSMSDLETHYSGFRTPHIHNLSELVQRDLGIQARKFGRLQLSDTSENSPNVLVFQISARLPFQIDIAFVSGVGGKGSNTKGRIGILTGASLTNRLEEKHAEFDTKFEERFKLSGKLDSESVNVGKAAIGNMLGGIGYFYGQSKVSYPKNSNLNNHDNFVLYWPAELYTAVPSRPFFPRGFLWDEGFHQLLIWQWDFRMSLDIIGHWLDLMNIDGWIPREQILGAEALSKVPEEFVLQYPSNGNPPTLFLALRDLISAMKEDRFSASEKDDIFSFLERAFVRLEAWFQWFDFSQAGKEMGSYFWHGRDNKTIRELNPKTLSSGLDDYPRASHPGEDERHVDLRCWMLLAADCMHSITKFFEKAMKPEKDYGSTIKLLSDFDILNQMHYDDRYGAYFDFGNHTEKVRLVRKEVIAGNSYTTELVREVHEKPELRLVPHIGYVSFFPFMARIIPPDSPILEKQFDLISNKSILWTDYGLRSLARTSSLYMKRNTEHDAPYWRGPVWINMNYMILSALHYYSKVSGPFGGRARVIYDELRSNLIRNVVANYYSTGYLWEQYDQRNGKGKGTRLFTGWTSLVLLIMSEAYPDP